MVVQQPETDAEFYLHVSVDALSTGAISFLVLRLIQKESLENSIKGALISTLMRGSASIVASLIKTYLLQKPKPKTVVEKLTESVQTSPSPMKDSHIPIYNRFDGTNYSSNSNRPHSA